MIILVEFLVNLNPVIQALLATLMTYSFTILGSALVFPFKRVNRNVMDAILEFFNLYDLIIEKCGVGASLPILSFGHSLMHASLIGVKEEGIIGIFKNIFDLTSSGISFVILLINDKLFINIYNLISLKLQ